MLQTACDSLLFTTLPPFTTPICPVPVPSRPLLLLPSAPLFLFCCSASSLISIPSAPACKCQQRGPIQTTRALAQIGGINVESEINFWNLALFFLIPVSWTRLDLIHPGIASISTWKALRLLSALPSFLFDYRQRCRRLDNALLQTNNFLPSGYPISPDSESLLPPHHWLRPTLDNWAINRTTALHSKLSKLPLHTIY